MTDKRKKRPLVREGEPSQTTAKGLEIPIPTREAFLRFLDKAAPKKETREKHERGINGPDENPTA